MLIEQLDALAKEEMAREEEYKIKLKRAREVLAALATSPEALNRAGESRTSWLVAEPLEELSRPHPLPARPAAWTVLAADGSQIYPDQHRQLFCYLLNIGLVVLPYGRQGEVVLASRPYLFYREEELYQQADGSLISPELIACRRAVMELEALAEAAARVPRPAVALVDGTLILWSLGAGSAEQQEWLQNYLAALAAAREVGLPLAGYISGSRATDVVNLLRLSLCAREEAVDCDRCAYPPGERPCLELAGLRDAGLWKSILSPGERSPVYRSQSRVLKQYGQHHVCFFYLRGPEEVARVEVPAWVATDKAMLDLVHSLVYDQAVRGQGYPVALAEAHEQAVVRAAERECFLQELDRLRAARGAGPGMTPKFARKRQGLL
ncbi:MAG: hypothetical protein PWP65_1544 [Clostridia bacterium]|nr:hypothetical protein [Clostridia bacterium]